jgi:hypothetical protein
MQTLQKQKLAKRAKSHLYENVAYRLVGADGREKFMFKDGFLNTLVLRMARSGGYSPYHADGTRKSGIRAMLALYGLRIHGITGYWTKFLIVANGVTTAGKAGVASRINGAGAEAAFTYIEVGTGTTAFDIADTALETPITDSGLERGAATASRVTTDTTNDTARLVITYTVTGTKAVTESGVLNASSSGLLLCRQTFSAINVVDGDSLQVTWDIDVD